MIRTVFLEFMFSCTFLHEVFLASNVNWLGLACLSHLKAFPALFSWICHHNFRHKRKIFLQRLRFFLSIVLFVQKQGNISKSLFVSTDFLALLKKWFLSQGHKILLWYFIILFLRYCELSSPQQPFEKRDSILRRRQTYLHKINVTQKLPPFYVHCLCFLGKSNEKQNCRDQDSNLGYCGHNAGS